MNSYRTVSCLDCLGVISSRMPLELLLQDIMQAKAADKKNKKTMGETFHCRSYRRFQGHTCRASSEDSLGLELMACISTSCSKQPHAQVQKVRQADREIDGAVKACFSWESRSCYKCVTDMLNPHRKQRGWGCCCCCCCAGHLPGPTQAASSANNCSFPWEI